MFKQLISLEECNQLKETIHQLIDKWDPEVESSCIFSTVGNREQSKSEYFLESADQISFFMEEDALDPNTSRLKSLFCLTATIE